MAVRLTVLFAFFNYLLFASQVIAHDDGKAEADYLLQQAINFLNQKDTTQAVSFFKKAIRKNHKLAAAHNQLALIYMNEGTVYGRFKATFEIERAIRFDPDNLQYRFNQAILNLKKGMANIAENQFKKILKKDPDNYECYLQLASIKEEELLHYKDMISIEPGSDGIIFFQEFADKLLDQTAEYYRKAISLQPYKIKAYNRLALILYEFDRFEEMTQLLESAVKINPNNKNCHLFLGLGYHALRKFELANAEFSKAGELMEDEEWAVMESVEPILSNSQKVAFGELGARERAKFVEEFWSRNEPFHLSEINERKLEHYSRVAYANLRFSDQRSNIPGWKTDMGKVYIRYGKPEHRYRTRPYLGGNAPGERNPLVSSKEIWIYSGFKFKFEDEFLSGVYHFARHLSPEFDYKIIFENMVKQKPQVYHFTPDSLSFPVPLDLVRFVARRKIPDIEFCFAIPLNSIRFDGVLPIGKKVKSGLFVFDENWKKVFKKKTALFLYDENFVEIARQLYLASHKNALLEPGKYHFSLEFEDDFSGKRGIVQRDLLLDSVATGKVKMSQILLAKKIEPINYAASLDRSDFDIVPNPIHRFVSGEPVAVYFEIYGLQQGSDGKSHYRIEYQVGENLKSISFWNKAMRRLGLVKNVGTVTTFYEYSSGQRNVAHYQYLTVQQSHVVRQRLKITVRDLLNGESASEAVEFEILQEEENN